MTLPQVLEVSAPAEHATLADHDHALPGGRVVAAGGEGLFGGQRFVRHVAAEEREAGGGGEEARGDSGAGVFFSWLESGVGEATAFDQDFRYPWYMMSSAYFSLRANHVHS